MTAQTTAGTTLGISATLASTFDASGFGALTHTAIGEITSIDGDIGRSYNEVTHNPISSRATEKFKGSYNSGTLTVQLAIDDADAGQVIAQAALLSDANYSFALTLQDGAIRYFEAKVMSFPVTPGSVDSITSGTIQLSITAQSDGSDFVKVAAS